MDITGFSIELLAFLFLAAFVAGFLDTLADPWGESHFLLKIGPKYLQFIVVAMCCAMLVKYGVFMGWLPSTTPLL
jgi:hypothetical protein